MSDPKQADLLAKARKLHQDLQCIRAYVLGGETPARVWGGTSKPPTFPQIRTLLALNMLGPCQLKDLSRTLDVSDPAASEMIDRLVEMGYVARSQDEQDRRRVVLELTPSARTRVEGHERHTLERLVRLMEAMGEDQVSRWLETSEALVRAVEISRERDASRD
jgi:DNA-binding MarR family transcriptional regulator